MSGVVNELEKINIDSFFPMEGDCYSSNGGLVVDRGHLGLEDVILCHGVAILKTDGLPYGHCWVEKGDMAIDISNGADAELPLDLYYALGNIPADGYKIYKYTSKEVIEKILEYGHWGPWDYEPPR